MQQSIWGIIRHILRMSWKGPAEKTVYSEVGTQPMYTIRSHRLPCSAFGGWVRMPKRKVWHRAIRLQDLSCLRSLQWPPLSASVPFSLSCLAPSPFLLSPHASRTAMAPAKQLTIMFKTKRETEKNHERRSLEQHSFNYASCFPMPIGFFLSLGVGVGGTG